jgi:cubilin
MNIEGNNLSCYFDKVQFMVPKKLLSSQWRVNRTVCGRFTGLIEIPVSNLLRINFITDSSVNGTGFDLTVSNLCGGTLYASAGVLSTDDVINSIHCEWTIIVREGRTIQIVFELLNIADNNNCQSSYLLLRNGDSKTSPFLGGGRFCGTNIRTVPESSSNRVHIEFYVRRDLHAVSFFSRRI